MRTTTFVGLGLVALPTVWAWHAPRCGPSECYGKMCDDLFLHTAQAFCPCYLNGTTTEVPQEFQVCADDPAVIRSACSCITSSMTAASSTAWNYSRPHATGAYNTPSSNPAYSVPSASLSSSILSTLSFTTESPLPSLYNTSLLASSSCTTFRYYNRTAMSLPSSTVQLPSCSPQPQLVRTVTLTSYSVSYIETTITTTAVSVTTVLSIPYSMSAPNSAPATPSALPSSSFLYSSQTTAPPPEYSFKHSPYRPRSIAEIPGAAAPARLVGGFEIPAVAVGAMALIFF